MLNRFAHFLLVVTALAPVALIHGIAQLPRHRWEGVSYIAVSALLALLCALVVGAARRYGEREPVVVSGTKNRDREVLAFLVSYALPLVTPVEKAGSQLAFWAVIVLIALVLYQTELVHVNPLLGMMGYKFFEVNLSTGETALLVTRGKRGANGRRSVVKISGWIWLEVLE